MTHKEWKKLMGTSVIFTGSLLAVMEESEWQVDVGTIRINRNKLDSTPCREIREETLENEP
jgi:hypothetical protein